MANVNTLAAEVAGLTAESPEMFGRLMDGYYRTGQVDQRAVALFEIHLEEVDMWAQTARSAQDLLNQIPRRRDPEAIREAIRKHTKLLATIPG